MTALILALVLAALSPTAVPTATWRIAPVVTWYGPGLFGNRTACGGILRRSTVGVASLRLPCGTRVRFRWRNHAITLRVIDRTGGVLFDQTKAAARLWIGRPRTIHNVSWRVVP